MKTCTKCGGNALNDYDPECRHDFGEAQDALVRRAEAAADVLLAVGRIDDCVAIGLNDNPTIAESIVEAMEMAAAEVRATPRPSIGHGFDAVPRTDVSLRKRRASATDIDWRDVEPSTPLEDVRAGAAARERAGRRLYSAALLDVLDHNAVADAAWRRAMGQGLDYTARLEATLIAVSESKLEILREAIRREEEVYPRIVCNRAVPDLSDDEAAKVRATLDEMARLLRIEDLEPLDEMARDGTIARAVLPAYCHDEPQFGDAFAVLKRAQAQAHEERERLGLPWPPDASALSVAFQPGDRVRTPDDAGVVAGVSAETGLVRIRWESGASFDELAARVEYTEPPVGGRFDPHCGTEGWTTYDEPRLAVFCEACDRMELSRNWDHAHEAPLLPSNPSWIFATRLRGGRYERVPVCDAGCAAELGEG